MPLPPEAAEAGGRPAGSPHRVDDVDDATARLTHLSGTVLRAPADVRGFGRCALAPMRRTP